MRENHRVNGGLANLKTCITMQEAETQIPQQKIRARQKLYRIHLTKNHVVRFYGELSMWKILCLNMAGIRVGKLKENP